MNNLNVVVIGGLHHNTLGVIRSLGEEQLTREQIYVLLIGNNISDNNFISQSKYLRKTNISYVNLYEQSIPWLLELASDGIKRVIICCSDGAAETIISHRTELENMYYMPSSKMNIMDLMEKDKQAMIAVNCGMNVPESMTFNLGNSIQWNLFPCIIKPIKSIAGAGKADIRIVNDYNELKHALIEIKASKIQIQQFIKKIIEFQLIGCSLDSGNKIIIPGFTRILRQPQNTNTGYLIYSPIKNLEFELKSIENLIKKIGYSGLFSAEFIRAEDGRDYFLEINLRNDGNAYCVKTAGINLPYIWCYYQFYKRMPTTNLEFEKPIWFIPDFNDAIIGIKKEGLIRWLIDFFTAQSHSIFNSKDMKPFVFVFFRLLNNYSKKIMHSLIKV